VDLAQGNLQDLPEYEKNKKSIRFPYNKEGMPQNQVYSDFLYGGRPSPQNSITTESNT
jgi:hypothetical protein